MSEIKFAGIDIGSNAIRLIIKNVIQGRDYKDAILNKLVYLRLPLRLGGDVFKYGFITDKKYEQFVSGLAIYRKILDFYKIEESQMRACATSATRDAKNGKEIINNVYKTTGIKIEIIDGIEEAEILFKTNRYNLPEDEYFMSADLGGGSLQITIFKDAKMIWSHSFKIGTVRILNNSVKKSEIDFFEQKMKEINEEFPKLKLIGSGGNINKISKTLNDKTVKIDDIEKFHKKLEKMTIEERIRKYSFRADRADVIVPAADIYIKLMKLLDIDKIYVPKTGLADGIIRELYEKHF